MIAQKDIIDVIRNPLYEYVSFDVFDTLIFRPFLRPTDLFVLLETDAKRFVNKKRAGKFREFRIFAERMARSLKKEKEDITLQDIYIIVKQKYGEKCAEYLKIKEMEYELEFSYRRKLGYNLYQEAVKTGKKILIISDMYLPSNMIKKILLKNGYDEFNKLYVSGEVGLSKFSSNLYRYVKQDFKIPKYENWLHIGDNIISDIQQADKLGIQTIYLAKIENPKEPILLSERKKMAVTLNAFSDKAFGVKSESYDFDFELEKECVILDKRVNNIKMQIMIQLNKIYGRYQLENQ